MFEAAWAASGRTSKNNFVVLSDGKEKLEKLVEFLVPLLFLVEADSGR